MMSPRPRPRATRPAASPAALAEAPRSTPLYGRVARMLEQRIQEGVYPVGALLPPELELAASLKVSRQTVRQAIAQLRAAGLLSARKGIGTRVEAAPQEPRFRYTVQSVADLFELARETRIDFVLREEVVARGQLVQALGCRTGQRWLHLAGPCRAPNGGGVLGWSSLYVEHRLAAAVPDAREPGTALFVRLEQFSGQRITEIVQEARPVLLGAEEAARLGATGPALRITRRYFAAGRRLMMVAETVSPADRFLYTLTFRPE